MPFTPSSTPPPGNVIRVLDQEIKKLKAKLRLEEARHTDLILELKKIEDTQLKEARHNIADLKKQIEEKQNQSNRLKRK